MQHEVPLHATSLTKWRQRVGAEKLNELLQETIVLAVDEKLVHKHELAQVNVDATVQEKNITGSPRVLDDVSRRRRSSRLPSVSDIAQFLPFLSAVVFPLTLIQLTLESQKPFNPIQIGLFSSPCIVEHPQLISHSVK